MKVLVRDTAKRDIENIRDYIHNVLKNPSAAKATVAKIRTVFPLIGDNPYIGASIEEKFGRKSEARYFISGNYIIVYHINVPEEAVLISRVFGGRQNYISEIFN